MRKICVIFVNTYDCIGKFSLRVMNFSFVMQIKIPSPRLGGLKASVPLR